MGNLLWYAKQNKMNREVKYEESMVEGSDSISNLS